MTRTLLCIIVNLEIGVRTIRDVSSIKGHHSVICMAPVLSKIMSIEVVLLDKAAE